MTMSDPIADLMSRIRNAILSKHDRVDAPLSKVKLAFVKVLKDEGYIEDFKVVEEKPQGVLRIYLRYDDEGTPAISHLARISKPGRRVYRGADEVPQIKNGLGVAIVSTSHGLLSDEQARAQRVGGEVLCEIW
ncbi:MAG: 30S ribosomal protein S8 [Acidobacteriota bacterium]